MPPITIAPERMPTHGRAEWLLTNGLGGFAMGCAHGVPERRYHALLIGALAPPVGRVVGLTGIADAVTAEFHTPRGVVAERRALSGFRFRGWSGEFAPPPASFAADASAVTWTYRPWGAGRGVVVERRLRLVAGRNAAVVTYTVHGQGRLRLELSPLTALRDFHGLTHGGEGPGTPRASAEGSTLVVRGPAGVVRFAAPGATLHAVPDWWWNFEYARDRERGQDCVEDLLCPGRFIADLDASRGPARLHLLAWMDGADGDGPPDPADEPSTTTRIDRAAGAIRVPDRAHAALLARAADAFVVRRDLAGAAGRGSMTTLIAGYPWFSDWGRDTMIALPGLLLATGRLEEARSTLLAFARMQRRGLVPNCFNNAGEAQYNTADGSLWFVHACGEYLDAGGDRATFDAALAPACLAVIDAYRDGTDFGIRMDPADGLIAAGDATTQLTWMDAARDGVVFTPRHGKPVEINALWHSTLRRLARAIAARDATRAAALDRLAARAGESFGAFWNPAGACLFDRLEPAPGGGWRGVPDVRPNQVFAASLPHSPLDPARCRAVVACVRERLLTPRGLRTLDPADPRYRPRYEGNLFERDAAYHNGTVWPYLLGAYAEAVLRTGGYSAEARAHAARALTPLLSTLADPEPDGPLGSVCEVYDADEPRRPQGCPMQAWSVAELLRAWVLVHAPGP